MTQEGLTVLEIVAACGLFVLVFGMALAVVRLVRGPAHADRVVAMDLLSVLIVAFLALYAVYKGQTAYLDVAAAYALIAFLGTVAFARFLERSAAAERRTREEPALEVGHE
jgi:multicomponent Na+:H+ antiporter subunit F